MKVYINIPASVVAGGVESLFQLADAINNIGGDSIIIWDNNSDSPVPDKYKHYNVKWDNTVEDNSENWIIYPEIWTYRLGEYRNIKKAIWWLSVDNNYDRFRDFHDSSITHFYQSFYALNFLMSRGTEKCLPLFDYIPSSYTESSYDMENKKNIVVYNPAKGSHITDIIKKNNPDLKFVPVVNMTESEIIDLLKSSKVYIDFGNHPGRDRIPRESAILGNCVITNKTGSAGFYGDIPIDGRYKFQDVNNIGEIIRNCFIEFESNLSNLDLYRSSILNQKEQLHSLCKQYFL